MPKPAVESTKSRILPEAGWANLKELPKGPNGRALCRWCKQEVPKNKRTFCSGSRAVFAHPGGQYIRPGSGCVHEHLIRSQPDYARRCVFARDQGQCASCPNKAERKDGRAWQMDHIVPVVEGGGSCGLENLRTLCTGCHKQETAKLAARRAEARRAEKGKS